MTLLRLKAKIYQYTGIYLAQREQDMAVETYFYAQHYNLRDEPENWEGMCIGSWQADNGFYRPMRPNMSEMLLARLRKQHFKYAYYATVGWISLFIRQLREDIT